MPDIATPIVIHDLAANRIKALITQHNNPNLKLRISVSGGGCSGFQYHFDLDEAMNDDDVRIHQSGITVLVDAISFPLLAGSELGFSEGLSGSQFVLTNPNATATCGCGTSFSV